LDPQRTLGAVDPTYESEAPSLGSLLKPNRLSEWSWTLGYTAILSTLTVLRYHVWLATDGDMGFNMQALWLLSHRGLLAVSTYTGHPVLADAASYILVLLAPLYNVGGVGFLLLLQAFALGLGYVLIRRIAEHLGVESKWAHLVGVVYLIYPTILGANLFDFHADVLAVPLLFAAMLAALEERWFWYAAALILALSVKDTVPIVVIGLGVTLLVRRRWLAGLATILAGAGVLGLDVLLVIPHLLRGTMTQWLSYYNGLGATPSAFLEHVLRDPSVLVAWVKSLRDWEYIAWILGPVAVMLALGRRRVLGAFWIPALLLFEANLLSSSGVTTDPFNEFSLLAIPFLFAVVVESLSRIQAGSVKLRSAALALPVLLLMVFVWHVHGPDWSDRPGNSQALTAASALIPQNAPVVAPNVLAAYFANRAQIYMPSSLVGSTLRKGTYVIFDAADPLALVDPDPAGTDAAVLQAVTTPGFAKLLYNQDRVTVYRLVRDVPVTIQGS